MHIQIGDLLRNAHIDTVGMASGRDSSEANIYDFGKIVEHWDRDLRPELGPLKHFDVTVLRGPSDLTGRSEFGFVLIVPAQVLIAARWRQREESKWPSI